MGEGIWLPIVDYAEFRGISISTIRRHIKAGRLNSRMSRGKYLIFVTENQLEKRCQNSGELLNIKLKNEKLNLEIRNLKEEINDLKMLTQVYEKELNNKTNYIVCNDSSILPELPLS